MKVLFLKGFNGRETNNIPYVKGTILDAETVGDYLDSLVERGIVELMTKPGTEKPDEPEAEPAPAPSPARVINKRVRRSK